MSEEKHSCDRVPAWDGDKRQWKRYLRDVELYLEKEKLESRLTDSARKYAENIELGADKDTREGRVAGVKYLLKSLERAMGMEDATKKGQVQEFFYKKLQRRRGQPMAEWVNVFEKAVHRKPGHVADRKPHDRLFRKRCERKSRRFSAHETMHATQRKTQIPRRKSRVRKRQTNGGFRT